MLTLGEATALAGLISVRHVNEPLPPFLGEARWSVLPR
jgi:hypothetical protein